MNASEVLALIKPIPSEQIIVGRFSDGVDKCCIIGHVTRLTSKNPSDYSDKNCSDRNRDGLCVSPVRSLTSQYMEEKHLHSIFFGEVFSKYNSISEVNNGVVPEYKQPEPKDRCVAFLQDMIKEGY